MCVQYNLDPLSPTFPRPATLSRLGVPITEDGSIGSKLVGLCTKRDLDLVDERHEPLSEHMTPLDQLVVGREGCSLEEAQEIIKVSKKGT